MLFSSHTLINKFIQHNFVQTNHVKRISSKTVQEISIPVPWGHIAGKWWGKKDVQPILAIHGWQDNAGTWDPLAELMADDYSILAIDLPGNGLSSHLPTFQNYYTSDNVGFIKRTQKYFGFDKLALLGHSLGSSVCFWYACIFPEDVKSYFGIDYIAYTYGNESKRVSVTSTLIDQKIQQALRKHEDFRRYTWEEAKNTWIKGTGNSLNDKSSEILLQRGSKKMSDGKYMFSRDHRLKSHDINVLNTEQIYTLAQNIRCNVRFVRATKSDFFNRGLKRFPELHRIIMKNAKSYKVYDLDGKHHLHMDIPDKFVPLLRELLENTETNT